MRSSTLDSLHTGVSPGSIGCAYTYSGPFREAQISEQPLWGFSSSNPDRSQSRAEQLDTADEKVMVSLPNSFKKQVLYRSKYLIFIINGLSSFMLLEESANLISSNRSPNR